VELPELRMIEHEIGIRTPTPIERVDLPEFSENGIVVDVKRDDLVHPEIIGNKLRKSLGHFELCRRRNIAAVVTFGGRYSNHILAISKAGPLLGFSTIGVVRGRDLVGDSPVLEACRSNGMRIVAVDGRDYYLTQRSSVSELGRVVSCAEPFHVIPEGGTSEISLQRTAAIIDEVEDIGRYAHIVCAVGTGGTAAGLAAGLAACRFSVPTRVLAIAVLRGYSSLPDQGRLALVHKHGVEQAERIVNDHLEFDGSAPFGRFGPVKATELGELCGLQRRLRFPLDTVYVGKVLLHIIRLVRAKRFAEGTRLLLLHTGGYQTGPVR
jgi:1-aminocyclopropane-1-carboxylate deaminase